MKKMHKIIGFSAAVVLVSGVTATVALPVKPFSQIKSQIGSFIFGNKDNDKKAACLQGALTNYRASLKDARDKYVALSKGLRAGYKTAVGEVATDLRNVNSSDKSLKNEKKKELSLTREAAVKAWSDKLTAAHAAWNEAQKAAIGIYRAARAKCSEQPVGANDNANLNTNENSNANTNF